MVTHKHHIVPRHAGGTDDPSNLVELTVEDHAIAHLVRYRIYKDERDHVAYRMLTGQISKQDAILLIQKLPKTEEHKKKIGDSVRGPLNGMYGKTISEEQREILRKANSIPKPGLSELYKERCKQGTHHLPVLFGGKNGMSRAIICDGVEYESVGTAAKALGVSRVTIYQRRKKGLYFYKY